jgi:hypothetical protein
MKELTMKAEFEEKQYEQHLNLELLQGENLILPPGQVLEHTFGFDAAIFSKHPKFWRHYPYMCKWYHRIFKQAPNGVKLPIELWEDLEHEIEDLPPFKFNVFIQHKRPEYMVKKNSAEWSSWNSPYYRYSIMKHQQETLIALENQVQNNAIVAYACPAFHTRKEFWDIIKNKSIIDNSNFCQPKFLENHLKYTFQNGGTYGIAHSEPEKIDTLDIKKQFKILREKTSNTKLNNKEYLLSLGEILDTTIDTIQSLQEQYYKMQEEMAPKNFDSNIAKSLIKIDIFNFLTDIKVNIAV